MMLKNRIPTIEMKEKQRKNPLKKESFKRKNPLIVIYVVSFLYSLPYRGILGMAPLKLYMFPLFFTAYLIERLRDANTQTNTSINK